MTSDEMTIYEMIGGEDTFRQLVDVFYSKVEADEQLRAMFPDDLEPGKKWQFLFLMQYWGGPRRYEAERGHPRLRMRHYPYPITQGSSDQWLTYMLEAIDEVGIEEPARSIMREYFERGAGFMVNTMRPTDGEA